MAVAHVAGLDFIRAEGYAFAHVADEGFIQSSAAQLLRYRRLIPWAVLAAFLLLLLPQAQDYIGHFIAGLRGGDA